MPRSKRKQSPTGMYHVMLRGINRQNIFEYREDYKWFLTCLSDAKKKSKIKLPGYCLMNNHVHLFIIIGDEPIGVVFKRISVKYALWYNRKYGRQGPLFQDRFKSEPIMDDLYFLSALRYIHQNPVKAGLCEHVWDYEWSSYPDYFGEGAGLSDTAEALAMFSDKPADQTRLFREFTENEGAGVFIDIDNVMRPTDDALRGKVIEICGARTASEFQRMPPDEKTLALKAIRGSGMSIRETVRLTGVPFGVVRKIGKGF